MKTASISDPFESVLVRDARLNDKSAIDDLVRYLDWLQAAPCLGAGSPLDASSRGDDFLEKALADNRQKIIIAEVGGQVVAYAHLLIRTRLAGVPGREQYYAEIVAVAVNFFYQRNGIGRLVIETAFGWATANGVIDQLITAPDFNSGARALYQRMGFKSCATVLRRTGAA